MNVDFKHQPQEMQRYLDTAFAPTPEVFQSCVEQQLISLQTQETAQPIRRTRWVLLVAALVLLIGMTAFAASRLGVLYFLTERLHVPRDAALIEQQRVSPIRQSYESEFFTAEIRDAAFLGDDFTICVYVAPKDPASFALLSEQDIGTDGEHMDWVWHSGKIFRSLAEWTPSGKQALVAHMPQIKLGGYTLLGSCDYVPEGEGIAFILEVDVSTMDILYDVFVQDLVQPDGTIEVSVTVQSFIDGSGEADNALIAGTIPFRLEEKR